MSEVIDLSRYRDLRRAQKVADEFIRRLQEEGVDLDKTDLTYPCDVSPPPEP